MTFGTLSVLNAMGFRVALEFIDEGVRNVAVFVLLLKGHRAQDVMVYASVKRNLTGVK